MVARFTPAWSAVSVTQNPRSNASSALTCGGESSCKADSALTPSGSPAPAAATGVATTPVAALAASTSSSGVGDCVSAGRAPPAAGGDDSAPSAGAVKVILRSLVNSEERDIKRLLSVWVYRTYTKLIFPSRRK